MTAIYTEECFVSAGEANPEQELGLPHLTSQLIETATAHANLLGIGNPAMEGINAGWVLARITIEMDAYPPVNSRYLVSTWVNVFNSRFSERNFKISSPEGRVYGYARSIWMVMNTQERANVGLSHLHFPENLIVDETAPIEKQSRHCLIADADSAGQVPSGSLEATSGKVVYAFKYSDLDAYRHVNTVRYVELLLNQYPLEDFDRNYVARLELSFMHEARYGMTVNLLRHDDGEKTSFLLEDVSGNSLFFSRLFMKRR